MIPILPNREIRHYRRAFERLDQLLALEDRSFYLVCEEISLWSPAEHLYHVSVANSVFFDFLDQIYRGEGEKLVRGGFPTRAGWWMLTSGKIPVGRAKAPEQVAPPTDVLRPEVESVVEKSRREFDLVEQRSPNFVSLRGRVPHFVMGNLNALQWLKFGRIHTFHHIRLVDRILAATG